MPANFSAWLRSAGLERLESVEQTLAAHDVGPDIFHNLTEADLEKLGISMGDRKRLARALHALPVAAGQPLYGPLRASAEAAVPAQPDAELRQLTIMFCDLVDSTALCERLTPEQWREVVLHYQQTAGGIIERYGGSIAQYLGDGLMVYFGHPQAYENASERALRAGLELVFALPQLQLGTAAHQPVRLSVRVGVHSGEVLMSEIGAGARRGLLALGETPHLAARLQALAAPDTVVVSNATRKLAGGNFVYEDLGRQAFKGISRPRQVWRVAALSQAATRFDAASGTVLTPLVGRAREIGELMARWRAAAQGAGQAVLICGEAGMGKSRVVRELRDRLGNSGLNAVVVQCSPHHMSRALHPFIDYLERSLGLTAEMPDHLKLDRLEALVVTRARRPLSQVALLASMLSIPSGERYGPASGSIQRHEQDTVAALVDLVLVLAAQEPLLLLLEDLHWADPASLAVTQRLIDRLSQASVMLIATHRPEFQPGWLLQAHASTLNVSGLSAAQVGDMVNGLAQERQLSAGLIHHIVQKTDGVPLFVEELTRFMLERGEDDGRVGTTDIPATLRDSLMARLDRFAGAKYIAQVAAVVGREFGRDLLEPLGGLSRLDTDQALSALVQSGLAAAHNERGATIYTFKHALVQDAAYDSLTSVRRAQLHGQVVRVVESKFPTLQAAEPALLARHAVAAGEPSVAIPYWRRASEQALQRLALAEAVTHLQAALDSTAALPPSPWRDQTEQELQGLLGTAHMLGRGWAAPEVANAFARAHALASAGDRVEEAIWPLWGVAVFSLVQGEVVQADAIGQRMMTVARQTNSRSGWLVANMLQAQLCMYGGRFDEAASHCEQVHHRYCDPQDRALIALYSTDLKLVVMVHGAHAAWIQGLLVDPLASCERIDHFAATLNHPYSVAWALTWGSMPLLHQGDVAALTRRVSAGLRMAEEHGFAYVAGMASFMLGWARAQQGELAAGIDQMAAGLAAFRATGAGIVVPCFQALLAEALGQAGKPQEGLVLLDQAWTRTEQGGERWHEAELHRTRGRLLGMGARPERAAVRLSFDGALAVATAQGAHAWRQRAEADLAAWEAAG